MFNLIPGAGLGLSDNAGILAFGLGHPFAPIGYYVMIYLIAADGIYGFSSRDLAGVVIFADRSEFLEAEDGFPRQLSCFEDRVKKFTASYDPIVIWATPPRVV